MFVLISTIYVPINSKCRWCFVYSRLFMRQ